jgi:hypothetical protein
LGVCGAGWRPHCWTSPARLLHLREIILFEWVLAFCWPPHLDDDSSARAPHLPTLSQTSDWLFAVRAAVDEPDSGWHCSWLRLLGAAFDTSPECKRTPADASLAVVAVVLTAATSWHSWGGASPVCRSLPPSRSASSPPDATAATAVLKDLRPPQRVGFILQGESLLNDATALLIYRAAVAAAVGSFSLASDGPLILLSAAGSVVAGYVLARIYLTAVVRVHDTPSNIVLQFISTFGVWLLADRLTLSPIITVVIYAMTLAQASPRRLSPRPRIAPIRSGKPQSSSSTCLRSC